MQNFLAFFFKGMPRNVLMAEQELYRREGLPWHGLELPDSTPVVSAIGHTFRILDEYSQQLAKGKTFKIHSPSGVCEPFVHENSMDRLMHFNPSHLRDVNASVHRVFCFLIHVLQNQKLVK